MKLLLPLALATLAFSPAFGLEEATLPSGAHVQPLGVPAQIQSVPGQDLGRLAVPDLGRTGLDAAGRADIPALGQTLPGFEAVETMGQGALGQAPVSGGSQLSAPQSLRDAVASPSALPLGGSAAFQAGLAVKDAGLAFEKRSSAFSEGSDTGRAASIDLSPSGLAKPDGEKRRSPFATIAAGIGALAATAASAAPAHADASYQIAEGLKTVMGLYTEPVYLGLAQFGLVLVIGTLALVKAVDFLAELPEKLHERSVAKYAGKSDRELLGLLADADQTKRGLAIAGMERKGIALAHADRLIDIVQVDADQDVRLQAIATLGNIRSSAAGDMLLRTAAAAQSEGGELLRASLSSLLRLGDGAKLGQVAKLAQVELAGYANAGKQASTNVASSLLSLYQDATAAEKQGLAAVFASVAALGGAGAALLARARELVDAGDDKVTYTAIVPLVVGKSVMAMPQTRTRQATGDELLERAAERLQQPAAV